MKINQRNFYQQTKRGKIRFTFHLTGMNVSTIFPKENIVCRRIFKGQIVYFSVRRNRPCRHRFHY